MKNKLGILQLSAILFLTFGITYIDFENLGFENNYKAYAQLGIGILLLYMSFIARKKDKHEGL